MQAIKILFFAFSILGCSLLSTSCGSDTAKKEAVESIDKSGAEYTSEYVCPMHCKGSGSASTGKCPVCQMAYVENKEASHDHHNHDGHDHGGHSHEGHNH